MEGLPYVPGSMPHDPGPLSRFLPPLEHGTVAGWLTAHITPGSWLLDPFGFSARLPAEAARAGYRVLVTVNNPVTRFLLELEADPPAEVDFKAALAELAASKRGDERLETHLQSLYTTRCAQCGREIQATEFLWKEGEDAPYARVYDCMECGDKGERPATGDDVQRAREVAASDALHRSRALERVAARGDLERPHVQEALQHYLPRPLYVLSTLTNHLESLNLPARRQRAITASVLVACDAGNTLWGLRDQRPRPKQLSTPDEFREQNLWMILEGARSLWDEAAVPVECVAWPARLSGPAGICLYEGRLKGLAEEVRKEIPIAAAVGSVPRPNQAFWTFSALWSGWLWGRTAVEPYRAALRRRRYDWAWNATALQAAFTHLADLLALGTPFFGVLPEAEPQFLLSAMTAISGAGFDLKGLAVRTQDDPIQFLWARGERLKREVQSSSVTELRGVMIDHLGERGEPASYLQLKAAALQRLAEAHALLQPGQDMETALRQSRLAIEEALAEAKGVIHISSGESIEAGTWGLAAWPEAESLSDRTEMVAVNFMQKKPDLNLMEMEQEIFSALPGLFTPSRQIILAVLESYAQPTETGWQLRDEDRARQRREDLHNIGAIIERTGERLNYKTRREGMWLAWEDGGEMAQAFCVLASAIVGPALAENPFPANRSLLVVPGGRAKLISFKLQIRPDLAVRMQEYWMSPFRLWRSLAEVKILTRETFAEQIASNQVESTPGQMMMF